MAEVDDTLQERQGRYGVFLDGARSWRELQTVLERQPGWGNLMQDQQYAATMIMMKLARAMNGSPDDTDNWHDIQGYAKLIEDRILGRGIYASKDVEHVQRTDSACTCTPMYPVNGPAVHAPTCPVGRSAGG